MARQPDPYRTLGLERTASLDDVKRAYRRLAKANHPDAAGEAALPRFLAIQAAYDYLVGPASGGVTAAPGSTADSPAQAWQADPARADATHRAYGGRARRPARETGKRTGSSSRPGTSARPGTSSSSGGPSSGESAGPEAGPRSDWTPRKATLGSTSYDGASRDAFEPGWEGASWYGTSSGTYWTTNPKEYADPRKHGPEYQARARRAARSGQAPAEAAASEAAGEELVPDEPPGQPSGNPPGEPPGDPPGQPPGDPQGEPSASRLSIGRRIVHAIVMARRPPSGPTGPVS